MSLSSHKKRRHNSAEIYPMIDLDSIDDRLFTKNNVFCLKVFNSFYNVLLMVLGTLAVCLGVWSYFTFYKMSLLLGSSFHQIICIILICSGFFIIFFVFFIGCCGSFNDSFCCWGFFSTSLLLAFIVDFIVCCSSTKYKFMISKDLIRYLQHYMNNKNNHMVKSAFDSVQRKVKFTFIIYIFQFRCCGVFSYRDWFEGLNVTDTRVPDSCCISETLDCGLRKHPSNIHYDGCWKQFDGTIQQQLMAIAFGSFSMCCVELFGVVLSCCLVKKMRESNSVISLKY